MARVLVTRRLPPGSLEALVEKGHDLVGPTGDDRPMTADELRGAVADVDAIVCLLTDRIDRSVIEAGSGRLRVIANVAVGFDNVDAVAATDAGIAVCNTPGVLDEAAADLAFLLVLTASRGTTGAEADLRAGRWAGWGINDYLGQDVYGRRLGIVGWGRIGRAVARRADGFGMTVRHHARRPTNASGYVADLDQLLRWSDVVTLHVPLTADTHHLIDARRLELMGPTSVLVNTSRGPVVEEEALAAALHWGTIFAAGLDVYEHEPAVHPDLLSAPNAVLLPHVGSATVRTRTAMGRLAAESVAAVLAGEFPPTLVRL